MDGPGLIPKMNGPDPNTATVLWNAMIYPFLNVTIFGAIWYQGEANAGYTNYNCTFPAMIDDWRAKWYTSSYGNTDPMFPFGFVQVWEHRPHAPLWVCTGMGTQTPCSPLGLYRYGNTDPMFPFGFVQVWEHRPHVPLWVCTGMGTQTPCSPLGLYRYGNTDPMFPFGFVQVWEHRPHVLLWVCTGMETQTPCSPLGLYRYKVLPAI